MKNVLIFVAFICLLQISFAQFRGCDFYMDCDCIVALTKNGTVLHIKVTENTTTTPLGNDGLVSLVKPWPNLPPFDQFTNYVGFVRRERDLVQTMCRPLQYYTIARKIADQSFQFIQFTDNRNTSLGIQSRINQRVTQLNFLLEGGAGPAPLGSTNIKGFVIVDRRAYVLLTVNGALRITQFDIETVFGSTAPITINRPTAYDENNQVINLDVTTLGLVYAPNGTAEAVTYDMTSKRPFTLFLFEKPAALRPRNMTFNFPSGNSYLSAVTGNSVTSKGLGVVNDVLNFVATLEVEDDTISVFKDDNIIGADYQCVYGNTPTCTNVMPDDITDAPANPTTPATQATAVQTTDGQTTAGQTTADQTTTGQTTASQTTAQTTTNPTTVQTTSQSTDTSDEINSNPNDNKNKNSLTIGLVVGIVGGLALVAMVVAFLLVRKNKRKQNKKEDGGEKQVKFQGTAPQEDSENSITIKNKDRTKSSVELITRGTIDDIQIVSMLGSGQFGDVYKGIWQGTTDCAIKKLKKNAGFEDFITEAKILSKLSHPNVVRLFGIFTDSEGNMNMVTEYMSKGSLLHLLQSERKTLTLSDLLKIARDSAAGMKYLESKNIIHRDLAARNLLAKQEDNRLVVKVADFGLSKVAESSYYGGGSSLFPIKWSPPEVVNYRKFTHKSDVWSFGIVLWEITEYGKVPYPSKSNDETMAAVLAGYRLPKPENCPEALYAIMLECWQEDPDKRPTFEDLFKRLSALINEIEGTDKTLVADVSLNVVPEDEPPYNLDAGQTSIYENDESEEESEEEPSDYGKSPV